MYPIFLTVTMYRAEGLNSSWCISNYCLSVSPKRPCFASLQCPTRTARWTARGMCVKKEKEYENASEEGSSKQAYPRRVLFCFSLYHPSALNNNVSQKNIE